MTGLTLIRASASRPSGEGMTPTSTFFRTALFVGRIFKANAAPVGTVWMWTLAFGPNEGRSPTRWPPSAKAGDANEGT
jgi:hypothetical protein